MINYEIPEYSKWIEYLRTNPPKTTGALEDMSGARCCLGHYCHINIPETRKEFYSDVNEVLYGSERFYLPFSEARKLNITFKGELSHAGARYARIFMRENNVRSRDDFRVAWKTHHDALSFINDCTNASAQMIGELIEHLVFVEKDYAEQCFIPFSL